MKNFPRANECGDGERFEFDLKLQPERMNVPLARWQPADGECRKRNRKKKPKTKRKVGLKITLGFYELAEIGAECVGGFLVSSHTPTRRKLYFRHPFIACTLWFSRTIIPRSNYLFIFFPLLRDGDSSISGLSQAHAKKWNEKWFQQNDENQVIAKRDMQNFWFEQTDGYFEYERGGRHLDAAKYVDDDNDKEHGGMWQRMTATWSTHANCIVLLTQTNEQSNLKT